MRLTAVLTMLLVTTVATPAHADPVRECRYQMVNGQTGWTTEEVRATIRCLAPRFGISTTKALTIAHHESGFQARASNGSYCGIYQHDRDYFPGRLAAAKAKWPRYAWMGRTCENARSNILAAFALVKQTGGWEAGWCRWTSYC